MTHPQPIERGEVVHCSTVGDLCTIMVEMDGLAIQAGDRVEVRTLSRRVDMTWETERDHDDTARLPGYSGGLSLADLGGEVRIPIWRRRSEGD